MIDFIEKIVKDAEEVLNEETVKVKKRIRLVATAYPMEKMLLETNGWTHVTEAFGFETIVYDNGKNSYIFHISPVIHKNIDKSSCGHISYKKNIVGVVTADSSLLEYI